jgi:hypothetical protein
VARGKRLALKDTQRSGAGAQGGAIH